MEMSFGSRLQHAWNAFMNKDPTKYDYGASYARRIDRPRFSKGAEKSIVTSVLNRMAVDVAQTKIVHARIDLNDKYLETIFSHLNDCLQYDANIDQTGRAFMQDVAMSMFDEGVVAIVPIDTTLNPHVTMSFDIESMRTAKIIEWFPRHVRVRVYNDRTGKYEDKVVEKETTAIIENPFYAVMNEPNSTLRRLIRKLALLDIVDEQSSAGKLDLIIQLPFSIRSEARKQQAEARRKDIEMQLANTKYGIAYTDATEKVTQINRPIENQLLKQVEFLTETLYSQLGITTEIMNGTADEKVMLNYYSRTIEPIVAAITDEMRRKFLSKTARTQGQSIVSFRDPFKLVPIDSIANVADTFTRNEIMTSNELRQIVGMKPADDPKADELKNSNLSESNAEIEVENMNNGMPEEEIQNE
jgi:hypothetical protein